MSTDPALRLSPHQLALKAATLEAVLAAGGQDFVAETIGRAQSRISDYCSNNKRDFMPLHIIRQVEVLGAGSPGHPHITRALVRAQGLKMGPGAVPPSRAGADLGDWLAAITRESADVFGLLADEDLSAGCGSLSPAARALIGQQLDELDNVIEQLRRALSGVPLKRSDSS